MDEFESPEAPVTIHVVSDLTGVPEPTLRAWERRYGVPTPMRRPSGYRLYGTREIAQVREMQRLVAGGVAASDAAALVKDRVTPDAPPPESATPTVRDAWSAQVDALTQATVAFDERTFAKELRKTLVLGSAVEIVREVIEPVLRRIGSLWSSGEVTVAAEHMAAQRIAGALRQLIDLTTSEASETTVLLACVQDELHDLGLMGTAVRLASWGHRPIVLGARTPVSAVASAVGASTPSLVMLGITMPLTPKVARAELAAMAEACGEVPLLVGGAGAADAIANARVQGIHSAPSGDDELRALCDELISGTKKQKKKGARR